MHLYGTFEHSLDTRGKRIVLPAAWRSCLAGAVPVDTTKTFPSIRMLSVTDMLGTHIELHLNAKYLHSTRDYLLNSYDGKDQSLATIQQKLNLMRQINGLVETKDVTPSKDAKKSLQIGLSDREMSVLQTVAISKDVVLVGQGEFCEIWPAANYEQLVNTAQPLDQMVDLQDAFKQYYHRMFVQEANKFAEFSHQKQNVKHNETVGD